MMDIDAINHKIAHIKRQSCDDQLNEKQVRETPFEQFVDWLDIAISENKCDPTSMLVATTDENGLPDTRIVLLKELENNKFIFYTNYNSKKAAQLEKNNIAALNFYWPHSIRQVRIRGHVSKVAREKSQSYFATRPRETQLGAHAWIQSSVVSNREEIDNRLKIQTEKFSDKEIICPEIWGGYQVVPFEYEFFQGRKWRFNDRLFYTLENGKWKMVRLAP